MTTNVSIRLTEFSDIIEEHIADFVGREWLQKEIYTLLDQPSCNIVLLTGGPGVGKTSFLASLAAANETWLRYFIRRDSRNILRPGDAATFLLTVGGQFASLYPELFHPENLQIVAKQNIESVAEGAQVTAIHIEELRASPFYEVALSAEQEIQRLSGRATAIEIGRLISDARLLSMQSLQYLGLVHPARLLHAKHPSKRIVILVDALDELRYSPSQEDVIRAIAELPKLPENLKFVISSRPEAFLQRIQARDDTRTVSWNTSGPDNREDLFTYLTRKLKGEEFNKSLKEEDIDISVFTDRLLKKSNGNFLYLKSVIDGIGYSTGDPSQRDKLKELLSVQSLPADLTSLYGYFLSSIVTQVSRRGFGDAAWRTYLYPVLGILAVAQEPLTDEQIVKFTNLKRNDIRDLLRELRQFIEVVAGEQTSLYRIYHGSFAEYLTTAAVNTDHWIDRPEAHHQISDYYLRAWGGLENKLPRLLNGDDVGKDRNYGIANITAHLEAAGRSDLLHALLNIQTDEGSNFWFQLRSSRGELTGYLADLDTAWLCADREYSPEGSAALSSISIVRLLRYALIHGSINSLSRNIRPDLLGNLIRKGLWQVPQSLAYALKVPDYVQRFHSLMAVAALANLTLRDEILAHALTNIRLIENDYYKALAIILIANKVPKQLFEQLVSLIREVKEEKIRVAIVAELRFTTLFSSIADEIFFLIRNLSDQSCRKEALSLVAPYLNPDRIQQRLQSLDNEKKSYYWASEVASLIPNLRDEQVRRTAVDSAVKAAWEMENGSERIRCLSLLASLTTPEMARGLIREALNERGATNFHWSEDLLCDWILDLLKLIPRLDPILREEVVSVAWSSFKTITSDVHQEELLNNLAPHLSVELCRTAFVIAINDLEQGKESTLKTLAAFLPEKTLHAAFVLVSDLEENSDQPKALSYLVPYLSSSLVHEIVIRAQKILLDKPFHYPFREFLGLDMPLKQWEWFDLLMVALTRLVTEGETDFVVTNLLAIKDEEFSAIAIGRLLPNLADLIDENTLRHLVQIALSKAPSVIDRPNHLVNILHNIIGYLNDADIERAFEIALTLSGKNSRLEAVESIADWLPPGLLIKATAIAHDIRDKEAQADVLASIAKYLPEAPLPEVLDVLRGREHEHAIPQVLETLCPHLSSSGLQYAFKSALGIQSEEWRCAALQRISPYLSGEMLMEAISEVNAVSSEKDRLAVLETLRSNLRRRQTGIPAEDRDLSEKETSSAHHWEMQSIMEKPWGKQLTPLPYSVLHNQPARLAALGSPGDVFKAGISEEEQDEKTLESWDTVEELLALADESQVRSFLDCIITIKDRERRTRVLCRLAVRLCELGFPEEALGLVKQEADEDHGVFRAMGIAEMSSRLSDNLLEDAIAISRSFWWKNARSIAFRGLSSKLLELPVTRLYSIWCETLPVLKNRSREDLLADLSSLSAVINRLAGQEGMRNTFLEVRDIARCWP